MTLSGVVRCGYTPGYYSPLYNRYIRGGEVQTNRKRLRYPWLSSMSGNRPFYYKADINARTFHTRSPNFDDENISSLYRKIQSGIYEKPTWLSLGSLELINQMLQVDAKKRITIKQLLTHPWLMEGYERPVKWQSKFHGNDLDAPIIEEMAGYKMTTPNALSSKLKQWDYDYLTSTYLLLFDKKQKGQSVRLTPGTSSPMLSLDLLNKEVLTTPKRNLLKEIDSSNTSPLKSNSLADSPRGLHNSLEGGLDDSELLKMGNLTPSKK